MQRIKKFKSSFTKSWIATECNNYQIRKHFSIKKHQSIKYSIQIKITRLKCQCFKSIPLQKTNPKKINPQHLSYFNFDYLTKVQFHFHQKYAFYVEIIWKYFYFMLSMKIFSAIFFFNFILPWNKNFVYFKIYWKLI